jgi:predicted amidohydrolase YtcJ
MRTLWMTGFIAAAQEADIAVWEQDPLRVPVNVLKDLKCVLTLLKGNIVYRDTQRLP